ncbi:MAG: hypothetical protein ABFS10_04050 [Bacteroidota bacterium]
MKNGRLHYPLLLLFIAAGITLSCDNGDGPEPAAPFEKVTGFVISPQGEKLVATDHGLFILNEEERRFEQAVDKEEKTPLNDLTFNHASSSSLWLASDSWAYNATQDLYFTVENSGLTNPVVTDLHFDNNLNTGYFATPAGLDINHQNMWTHSPGFDDLYIRFDITDIGTATNGYTYVTTNGGGIERFQVDVDGVSGATVFDSDWTQLGSNHVHTVYIDDTIQGYGTDRGVALHFSEYTKWDWEVYTTSDGLINDTVLAVTIDSSDNWWFGTTGGISRLVADSWTNFSVETHQLISNQIRFLAVDVDGSVWAASDQGLSHFTDAVWINYPK